MIAGMSTANLLWNVLFSAIGGGYMLYGFKQKLVMPVACGLALGSFGYFVENSWLMVLVGAFLIWLPFKFRM
jgi:hypothetical protein